jgi:hypothetical protein
MAIKQSDIDYSKSTGAYPMPKDPTPLFIDNTDIDYSKSTGAYPMYDESSVNTLTERVVEHIDADVDPQFTTPGPQSQGIEEHVAVQRKDLGLSADPTGESDAGYEARPSTVPVPGADGVDREAEAKVVEAPEDRRVRRGRQAQGK